MYHEKIDHLLDTYARKLAENMNQGLSLIHIYIFGRCALSGRAYLFALEVGDALDAFAVFENRKHAEGVDCYHPVSYTHLT